MRITSVPQTHDWQVWAEWLGADRVVFTGSLHECLRFVAKTQEETDGRLA